MAQIGRLTERGFHELHHTHQIRHAMAGRARRCHHCDERKPASEFSGSQLVCDDCGLEMVAPPGWSAAEGHDSGPTFWSCAE